MVTMREAHGMTHGSGPDHSALAFGEVAAAGWSACWAAVFAYRGYWVGPVV
jgi:hypothetical protein